MAVSFVGSQLTTATVNVTSLSVGIPAGGTEDLAVVVVHASGDFGEASITLPSGWTAIDSEIDVSGGDLSDCVRAFYKKLTSSGSTAVTVQVSGLIEPGSGDLFEGLAFRYSGVDQTTPVPEIAATTLNVGVGSTIPHNAVTVGSGNWSVLLAYQASSVGRTPPAGWTEDYDAGRFTTSHREYATGASTGAVSTTTSNSVNRIGYHFEVAAKASATIVANHLASAAVVHNPTVVPGARTVVANHLGPTATVYSHAVPKMVVADHLGPTSARHQPAVTAGAAPVTAAHLGPTSVLPQHRVAGGTSTVAANHLGPTAALYQPRAFLGAQISLDSPSARLGPVAELFMPGVLPGIVTIVIGPFGGGYEPVLWDDGSPVLWDDGSPVEWGSLVGTGPTTQVFAPGVSFGAIPVPHLGPTSVLYAPTTRSEVPVPHLGPTSTVYAQLVGTFQVLVEPDEAVWGASGGFSARVDFLDPGGSTIASTGDPRSRIVLVSGSVNEDSTQAVTREVSLRLLLVADDEGGLHPLLPAKPGDPLDPRTGGAVAVYAGPLRPSGTPDYTKLGVFKITEANASSTGTGEAIELRGLSQEHEIRAAGFWIPEVVLAGTKAVDAIVALTLEAVPDVNLTYETTATTVPGELSWGDSDDRLDAVNEIARAVAMTARFDREGVFRVQAAAQFGDEPDQSPRWTLNEGDLATVRDVGRSITDAELHNGVVVVGEPLDSAADPVRAEVWDTRPTSPVYYDPANPGRSLIGPRPKKVVSNLVTTFQQAEAMAAAELAKVLSFADRISVTMAANPEVEALDVVRVVRSTMGVDALYRVESVTHDLLGGASSAVCVAL